MINKIRQETILNFRKGKIKGEIKGFKIDKFNISCKPKYAKEFKLKRDSYQPLALKNEESIIPTNEKNLNEIKETKQIIENNQNGVNDDIKKTITEKINKDYSWCHYSDYDLVMCNKNGYINASVLISKAVIFENKIRADNNRELLQKKEFRKWQELKDNTLLYKTVCFENNITLNDLFFDLKGSQKKGEELLKGAYLHPSLINSVLMWVSPSYAYKINMFINKMNEDREENAKDKRIKDLTRDISEKADLIMDLKNAYNEISKDNKIMIENNKMILQELKNVVQVNTMLHQTNQVISNQLIQTNHKLTTTNNYLHSIKDNIAVKTYDEDLIIILKIMDMDNNTLFYKIVRTTYLNKDQTLYYHRKKCSIDPILTEPTVNGKTLCKRFLNENQMVYNYSTSVYLKPGYSEDTFKNDLRVLLQEAINAVNNVTN